MRIWITLLCFAGCIESAELGPPMGRSSRPFTAIPQYLQHPVGERDRTPTEQLDQMAQALRDIDAEASADTQNQAELKEHVAHLKQLVPPKPDLLVPVERMQKVVDDIPRNSAVDTRRRLWALTDLIRLRANF
jgi:hypothetical protein